MPRPLLHPEALRLAELLRAEWPAVRERIRLSGHPTCEGDENADDNKDTDDKPDAKYVKVADDGGDDKGTGDKDDDAKVTADDDWKAKARKHERDAKRERQEREKLAARLADIEKANLSEQEKAIAKAREEAAAEVTTKYEAQRREDRIESAVTKLSLRGFKAKDKDGNETTLRFADPDDAQLRLERAIRNDDLSYDDIYADGKVKTEAIMSFLTELLEEHPRLRADDNGGKKDPPPDFDGGKGKSGGSKSLEEMSPEDHFKDLQKA